MHKEEHRFVELSKDEAQEFRQRGRLPEQVRPPVWTVGERVEIRGAVYEVVACKKIPPRLVLKPVRKELDR